MPAFCSSFHSSHNDEALRVKSHNVGLAEVKANRNSAVVEDFSFVCAGYSLFMSKNEGSITKDGTKPQLPHCRGLAHKLTLQWFQYLQHLAPPNPNPASAPAHVHSKGGFTRKANLIASRVARDMCRVGNNIKNNVEDILFSSRRPPK
ncbi:hypothetical protein GOBAR_DD28824 [Gossypium barbadense]|nr:hypothetical protein GOBAR_DD28824 [Gossypium barbadense]